MLDRYFKDMIELSCEDNLLDARKTIIKDLETNFEYQGLERGYINCLDVIIDYLSTMKTETIHSKNINKIHIETLKGMKNDILSIKL